MASKINIPQVVSYFIKKDKHFITNHTNNLAELYFIVEVYSKQNCHEETLFSTVNVLNGGTKELNLNEGKNTLIIKNLNGDVIQTIYTSNYLKIETSIIEGVFNTLCDCNCGCSNCNQDSDSLCNILMLKTKIDVYKSLIFPTAQSFFNSILKHVECLIKKPIYCSVDEEIILGSSNCNEKLIKQIIALEYLSMYFFQIAQANSDEDEIKYVKEKFNIKEIFCCIDALGIDITDIENLINNNMGTFTINNAGYINLPPSSVGDITIAVVNRSVTTLTLAMFTTNTTPAYADPENDPVDAIRIDTLPLDGVLVNKDTGLNVVIGDIIPVNVINGAALEYHSPNQNALSTDKFNFSIRDTGSMQWSS